MFKRITASVAIVAAVVLTGASSASAAGAEDFALVCDLNSSYRARVDMDNVYITQMGGKVDADDIWWRALDHDNHAVSIRVEEVRIELYDSHAADWVTWTTKGGTTTDGTTVAPSVHWDPSAKYNANAVYTKVRLKAWYGNAGSSGSCTSPVRTR